MKSKRAVLALFVSMLLACAPLGTAFAESVSAENPGSLSGIVQDGDSNSDDEGDEASDEGDGGEGEETGEEDGDGGEEAGDEGDGEETGGEETVPVIDLAKCEVVPIEPEVYAEGEEIEPDVTIVYRGKIDPGDPDDADDSVHEFVMSKYDNLYNVTLTYSDNISVGTATVKIVAIDADEDSDIIFTGSATASFTIDRIENPMTVSFNDSLSVKYKIAKQVLKSPAEVDDAVGAVTYSKVSGKPYFKVDKRTGKLTVAAKTPAGTYKLRLGVKAQGDGNYKEDSTDEMIVVHVKKAGANSLSVAPVKKTLTASSGKRLVVAAKNAFKVKKNAFQGKVSYKKVSGTAKIKVSSSGSITVNPGLKKGKSYPVKVRVTTPATKNYGAGSATCAFNVKIAKK